MTRDIFVLIEHIGGKVLDISYLLLAQARQITQATGGQVIAILLGHHAEDLAADLGADAVWYVDHPRLGEFIDENYLAVLQQVIAEKSPRLFLLGETTIGNGLAAELSVLLDLPLVCFCRQILVDGSQLGFTSQICGGKLMADGLLPVETTVATMVPGAFRAEQGKSSQTRQAKLVPLPGPAACLDSRDQKVKIKRYIEPDSSDIDITRESILVSIGRGIQSQDNLSLAQDLAEALGGVVSGSRPTIDQGWLPSSRLVGKSGKTVKPVLYLALGISGAPEHTEAISGAETIIAVNTDPTAPIFRLARYGAQVDLLDLVPVLIERIREEKGMAV